MPHNAWVEDGLQKIIKILCFFRIKIYDEFWSCESKVDLSVNPLNLQ